MADLELFGKIWSFSSLESAETFQEQLSILDTNIDDYLEYTINGDFDFLSFGFYNPYLQKLGNLLVHFTWGDDPATIRKTIEENSTSYEDYKSPTYSSLTARVKLNDDIIKAWHTQIAAVQPILATIIADLKAKEDAVRAAEKKEAARWKEIKVFKKWIPSPNSFDSDDTGIIDSVFSDGIHEIRMLQQDIFDAGVSIIPKRVADAKEYIPFEKYTDIEKDLTLWLRKHSRFQGIRM